MSFKGDYHIHTEYSDGRATIEEMVNAAQLRGLQEVGISDHGPANIVGIKDSEVLRQIKRELSFLQVGKDSLKLFIGVEANVINPEGDLDVARDVLAELDYLIAGLHPYTIPRDMKGFSWVVQNNLGNRLHILKRRLKNTNTKALIEAMYKYPLDIISHPGLKMDISFKEVARACIKRKTLWEINTGHKHPSLENILEIADSGVDFIVNSDAHFPEMVGNFEYGSWLLEKAKVPPERIVNRQKERREWSV